MCLKALELSNKFIAGPSGHSV